MEEKKILDRIKAKKINISSYIHKKIDRFKKFIGGNNVEILTIIGASFIIKASFLVNLIFGLYTIGFILIGLVVFMVKNPKK